MRFIDLTGQQFGWLTVVERGKDDYVSPRGHRAIRWLCACECGANILVVASNLRSGGTTSCGHKRHRA